MDDTSILLPNGFCLLERHHALSLVTYQRKCIASIGCLMVCTTLAATHHWFPGVLGRAFGKSKNDLFVNLQSGTLRVCKLDGEGELANCIVGSASSTACASDVLLLCAPGDSCFQNQQNVAYCCAAGHFGWTRLFNAAFLQHKEAAMGLPPKGCVYQGT